MFTAKDIDLITEKNKISDTATASVFYENNVHQVRLSESRDSKNGFVVADMKIDFNGMSTYKLKNAILTAHGEVIALDKNGNKCTIVRIFGVELDKIGLKNVLGVTKAGTESIGVVVQNSGRETAIQVNP